MTRSGATARVAELAAVVPGWVLRAASGAAGLVRPASKPLHPAGSILPVTVRRHGLAAGDRVGVAWIDEPGVTEGLVRFSRAVGLPPALPDIHGLALRFEDVYGRRSDVLMATTGLGRFSRFLLVPTRRRGGEAYSTLLPYRSPQGPVQLAAVPDDREATTLTLAVASTGGPWRPFAELSVTGAPGGSGDDLSFDPTLNMLEGLEYYAWETRLREGAYGAARWSRRVRG
jgi:hypothetical protein